MVQLALYLELGGKLPGWLTQSKESEESGLAESIRRCRIKVSLQACLAVFVSFCSGALDVRLPVSQKYLKCS